MSDFSSELPIRSQLPGQANYDDVIVKIADGTTSSQLLAIDAAGKPSVKLDDGSGTAITSRANGAQQALDIYSQSAGPVTPGTVAAFSDLIGGQYNSTLPTLTTGQQSAVQVDSHGRLLVVSTDAHDTNYGTVGADTLRTAAQIGNATGAADFNYGAVDAQTLRTASQIGNATGAADFNAGATGAQTLRTAANQGAPNTNANAWWVHLTDGTNNTTVTAGGALLVSSTNFPTTVDTNYGVVGANTLRTAAQIGNATGAADFNAGATSAQTLRVVANQGAPNTNANGWFTRITDGTNNATVTAGGALNVVSGNFPTTVDTNYGTVGANTIRTAAQIGNATGAADFNNGATGAQTLRVAANLAVAGANVSATNPVPVSITTVSLGTPVNDYKVATAVAAAASDIHDYAISAGKTFQGRMFWASGSGSIKVEVQISPDGTAFTTKWVGFSSSATPNIEISLDNLYVSETGAGSKIRMIVTNTDKKSQDLYSTLSGTES